VEERVIRELIQSSGICSQPNSLFSLSAYSVSPDLHSFACAWSVFVTERTFMNSTKTIQIGTACMAAALIAGCATHPRDRYEPTFSQAPIITEPAGAEWRQGAGEDFRASRLDQDVGATRFEQDEMVIPLYEERIHVGKEMVETGEVRLRKYVTTETVNHPLELRRETVVIERIPAGAQAQRMSSGTIPRDAFQEEELTIRLREEQPFIERETVVSGQVVARRQPQTERVNITREIRREHIEVDQTGERANVEFRGDIREAAGAGRPEREIQDNQDWRD
jgi:uncharacterized protein (TIGR02271 family)